MAGVVTAKIKDYDQAVTDGFAFAVVPGWSPNTATASLTGDTLTVTGLADGQEALVTVEAAQTGYASDTAVMTANALETAHDPTFDATHEHRRKGHPDRARSSPSRSTTGPTPTCSPGPRNWSTPRPCPTGHQLTSTRPPVWSTVDIRVATRPDRHRARHRHQPRLPARQRHPRGRHADRGGVAGGLRGGDSGPDAGVVTAKIKDYDQAVTDGFAFAVVPGWSPNTATASLTGDTLTVTGLADGPGSLGHSRESHPDRIRLRHRGHDRQRVGNRLTDPTFDATHGTGGVTQTAHGFTVKVDTGGPTPTCSPGPRNWSTPRPCPTGHELTSTRPPVWSPWTGWDPGPGGPATVRVTATNPDYLPGSATQEARRADRGGAGRWTSWR